MFVPLASFKSASLASRSSSPTVSSLWASSSRALFRAAVDVTASCRPARRAPTAISLIVISVISVFLSPRRTRLLAREPRLYHLLPALTPATQGSLSAMRRRPRR